jgi:heptose I phosphotransferase
MLSRVTLHAPFDRLWSGVDPFSAIERLQGQVFRQLEARKTLRTEIEGAGYFVKIHRGVGWGEILKNLVTLRLPVLGADNEWEAIHRLRSAGVDTMDGVAFGSRGCNPARRHSFIVTREIAPSVSLEDYCRDWPSVPPHAGMKHALIRRVAGMARAMHACGVNHRDFYICHFLLHCDPPPTPRDFRLALIDLHRAQCRPSTPRRWRDKDLAGLYFSALEIGLTERDYLRFLKVYFARPLREILEAEAPLLRHLHDEGERLMARFRRKYARPAG